MSHLKLGYVIISEGSSSPASGSMKRSSSRTSLKALLSPSKLTHFAIAFSSPLPVFHFHFILSLLLLPTSRLFHFHFIFVIAFSSPLPVFHFHFILSLLSPPHFLSFIFISFCNCFLLPTSCLSFSFHFVIAFSSPLPVFHFHFINSLHAG